MKNKFVTIALMLIATTAVAKETPKKQNEAATPKKIERKVAQVESQTPEAMAFVSFLACKQQMQVATDASWISCLDPMTVSAPFRRQSFVQFLMTPIEIKTIRDCTKSEKSKAAQFPGVTDSSVCFDYTKEEEQKAGAAFFMKSNGTTRLFSLYDF